MSRRQNVQFNPHSKLRIKFDIKQRSASPPLGPTPASSNRDMISRWGVAIKSQSSAEALFMLFPEYFAHF